jgi:hypothetical protein
VLHDWDDDPAVSILKNCRPAMGGSEKILVLGASLPDLNMLVMSGGQERTEAVFGRLFSASGFCLTRVVPALAPVSTIEGIPA